MMGRLKKSRLSILVSCKVDAIVDPYGPKLHFSY